MFQVIFAFAVVWHKLALSLHRKPNNRCIMGVALIIVGTIIALDFILNVIYVILVLIHEALKGLSVKSK